MGSRVIPKENAESVIAAAAAPQNQTPSNNQRKPASTPGVRI
jgi:hypothetical protein